jgi:hypothetical protein
MTLDIDSTLLLVFNATGILTDADQNQVLQNLANKIIEWYDVSRDEMRVAMEKLGLRLEELCVNCKEEMPNFDGIGDPLCSDCESV